MLFRIVIALVASLTLLAGCPVKDTPKAEVAPAVVAPVVEEAVQPAPVLEAAPVDPVAVTPEVPPEPIKAE